MVKLFLDLEFPPSRALFCKFLLRVEGRRERTGRNLTGLWKLGDLGFLGILQTFFVLKGVDSASLTIRSKLLLLRDSILILELAAVGVGSNFCVFGFY
mgnify:CR=1 FL=1